MEKMHTQFHFHILFAVFKRLKIYLKHCGGMCTPHQGSIGFPLSYVSLHNYEVF